MSEEEKAIERCNQLTKLEHANWIGISNQKAIKTILSLIQKQQEEIDSLKDIKEIAERKVTDLRKIKQVDKLESENYILRKKVEKKDKIIDEMAEEYSKYQILRSCPNEITETVSGIKDRFLKKIK